MMQSPLAAFKTISIVTVCFGVLELRSYFAIADLLRMKSNR